MTMPGGFGPLLLPNEFPEEARVAFEVGISKLYGVNYEPLALQQQVVAGMNYTFFCKAQVVAPNTDAYMARVHIFASLPDKDGKRDFIVTSITRVSPSE